MAGPEGMRGRELERIERSFLLAAGLSVRCSQENGIRERLLGGFWSLFWCVNRWTWEEDSRELPSTFLKRKREQSKLKFQTWVFTRRKWRSKKLLGCSICLRKSKKRWGGVWWLHGQVLVYGVCHHACFLGFTCVDFQLIACGWNFHYNISCIIHS